MLETPSDDQHSDDLSALLSDLEIPESERAHMGRFAGHLLHAQLASSEGQDVADLRALLLSRWDWTLSARNSNQDSVVESFEVTVDELGYVLGQSVGEVRAGMARLVSRGDITAVPSGNFVHVSFKPTVALAASAIAERVYRDFLARHGRHLFELASSYAETVGDDLEEAEKVWPGPPTAEIRKCYRSVLAAASPNELWRDWGIRPHAMYEWLDRLALVEREIAILSGFVSLGLTTDLHAVRRERVVVLYRRSAG